MDTVALSVPFMILSTQLTGGKNIEKHVLTPFGSLDISVPADAEDLENCEIHITCQMGNWMVDDTLPPAFRNAILDFVHSLIRKAFGLKLPPSCNIAFMTIPRAGHVHVIRQEQYAAH